MRPGQSVGLGGGGGNLAHDIIHGAMMGGKAGT